MAATGITLWVVMAHASGGKGAGDSAASAEATTAEDLVSEVPACGSSNEGDRLGMSNPAAIYCKDLGYDYRMSTAADGSEQGICVFPDGSSCEEWSFLNGECGSKYSYCAKQGYKEVAKHGGHGSLSRDYAECVNANNNQELGAVDDMMDLSKRATRSSVSSFQATADSSQTNLGTTPASFDWRNQNGQNWMTSVKNQGACGSCWAFASTGAVEGAYNIQSSNPNLDLDLSEEYLVSDCYSWGSYGNCCGGSYTSALAYVRDNGVPDEGCMPYVDQSSCTCGASCDTNCTYRANGACSDATCANRCSNYQTRSVKISSVAAVPSGQMKQYLVDKGPLVVAMGVGSGYGGTFDSQGVYHCTIDSGANHAVLITGYNDAGGYWIVKNSWGSTWNGDGYFKVGYGECAIESSAYYVTVSTSPSATATPASGASPTPTRTATPTATKAAATPTRTPMRTPTRTPTRTPMRTPTRTPTRTPAASPYCGDVTGDGRVTTLDIYVESFAIQRGISSSLYDVNYDGRVSSTDLYIVQQQLGRYCRRY